MSIVMSVIGEVEHAAVHSHLYQALSGIAIRFSNGRSAPDAFEKAGKCQDFIPDNVYHSNLQRRREG